MRFRSVVSALLLAALVVPRGAHAETSHAWESRYGGIDTEDPYDVAVSPDGRRVFVTGSVEAYIDETTQRRDSDWLTVAFDAETGARLWSVEHDGPGTGRYGDDRAYAVVVTPDGGTVLVAGETQHDDIGDATVVAYDAADGSTRWTRSIDGPLAQASALFDSLAVTPDGATAILIGNVDTRSPSIPGWGYELDLMVVALDVASGQVRWQRQIDGIYGGLDHGTDVEISPSGTTVAVTAQSGSGFGGPSMDGLTMLMWISDGATIWSRAADQRSDIPVTTLFAPSGDRLYVAGRADERDQMFVEAYDAASGEPLWVRVVDRGSYSAEDVMAIAPSGDDLFVAGWDSTGGWSTLALAAVDGSERWSARISSYGSPVAVESLQDGTVVVAGTTAEDLTLGGFNIGTIGLSPVDGSTRWRTDYDNGGGGDDLARAMIVAPGARRTYTIGKSWGWSNASFDYAVIANGPGCAGGMYEDGPLSRRIDVLVEPVVPATHEVNCSVVAPVEP